MPKAMKQDSVISFDDTLFVWRSDDHTAPLRSEFASVTTASASSPGVLTYSSGGVSGSWHVGYSHYEHLPWRDAFLNAAMLLGGMGPVKLDLSEPGKVFAGLYALYSGLVVIAVTALLLAPGIHHMMKRAHWEDRSDTE